jgi:hypothetical protein
MTISPTSVHFGEDTIWVELTDDPTLGVPLAWFPRLLHATPMEPQLFAKPINGGSRR